MTDDIDYSEWLPWFAWHPVRDQFSRLVWLRPMLRKQFDNDLRSSQSHDWHWEYRVESIPFSSRHRLPTVAEIISVIRSMPYHCEQCVHVGHGPLDEMFIDVLGVWVDFDGKTYSGDCARGFDYPGWYDAWRLRRAIQRWKRYDHRRHEIAKKQLREFREKFPQIAEVWTGESINPDNYLSLIHI